MPIHKRRQTNLAEQIFVSCKHSRHVHHFTETGNSLLFHEGCKVATRENSTSAVKWRCRDTGWKHEPDIKRYLGSLLQHIPQPCSACDIRNLMGVGKHGGGSVRDHRTCILRWCQKRTFNMHVCIYQPGKDAFSPQINSLVCSIRPESGYPPVFHTKRGVLFPLSGEWTENPGIRKDDVVGFFSCSSQIK